MIPTLQVNVDSRTLETIKEKIAKGEFNEDLFQVAEEAVVSLLDLDLYRRWQNTVDYDKLFKKWASPKLLKHIKANSRKNSQVPTEANLLAALVADHSRPSVSARGTDILIPKSSTDGDDGSLSSDESSSSSSSDSEYVDEV